jgi:hypothetical protein
MQALQIFRAICAIMVVSAATYAADPATRASKGAKSSTWRSLFDGVSLKGWKLSDFYKPGAVKVEESFRDGGGAIILEQGTFLTGITWAGPGELWRNNYEIELEAMRVEGGDFFCGLTFPVRESACTFVVGGWGGRVVGISSIDDSDASDNETAQAKDFESNRWYRMRVRVTDAKLEAWIDQEQVVDLETKDRKIGLRGGEIEESLPLGVAAYQTKAAIRNIRVRKVEPAREPKK